MMRSFLWVACACLLLASVAIGQEAPERKILLIYTAPDHPHGTHMYEHECRLLARCLEQSPGVRAEVSFGWPRDASMLDGVSSIVFYSHPASEIVLSPAHREAFAALMAKGVGFAAIHWATGTLKIEDTQDYIGYLGGCFNFAFVSPPLAVTEERLVIADPSHPIAHGVAPFDLRDEWYLSMRFDPRARPLLRVLVRPDEKAQRPEPVDLTIAWTFERKGQNAGRSFGATIGHFHDNFGVEHFRRLLVNAILWTAHAEVPALGAPVGVDDTDLILPPPPMK